MAQIFSVGWTPRWLESTLSIDSHAEVLRYRLVTRDKPKGVGLGGYSTNEEAVALKHMEVLSTFSCNYECPLSSTLSKDLLVSLIPSGYR